MTTDLNAGFTGTADHVPGTHLDSSRWPTVLTCLVHLRVRISEIGTLGALAKPPPPPAAAPWDRRDVRRDIFKWRHSTKYDLVCFRTLLSIKVHTCLLFKRCTVLCTCCFKSLICNSGKWNDVAICNFSKVCCNQVSWKERAVTKSRLWKAMASSHRPADVNRASEPRASRPRARVAEKPHAARMLPTDADASHMRIFRCLLSNRRPSCRGLSAHVETDRY